MALFKRFQIPPPSPDRSAEVVAIQEQIQQLTGLIREGLGHLAETVEDDPHPTAEGDEDADGTVQ